MADSHDLALPVRVQDGTFVTVEQGSLDDIAQRVEVLLRTPLGWLASEPDFGVTDQSHQAGGVDVTEVEEQIATWVPDADALVEQDPDALNEALAIVGVRIGAKTGGDRG